MQFSIKLMVVVAAIATAVSAAPHRVPATTKIPVMNPGPVMQVKSADHKA